MSAFLARREVYRVGVDYAGALPAHHGDDVSSVADELTDELDVLDGGDAAGDAGDCLPSLQLLALCAVDALTRVHAGKIQEGRGLIDVDGQRADLTWL